MLDLNHIPRRIAELRRIAAAYNVTLPASLVSVLDSRIDLPDRATVEAEAAAEIAAALGTRNAEKVRDAALARVASAQAADRIRGRVHEATILAHWTAVREHGDALHAAFREVIADDLAALAQHAQRVPLATTADSTNVLPEVFTARHEGQRIAARVEDVARIVAGLRGRQTTNVTARMFLARLPENLPGDKALALALGFHGKRYGVQAGGVGIVQNPALWWVAVAQAGAEFDLVDVAEARQTEARMAAAARVNQDRPETERSGLVL